MSYATVAQFLATPRGRRFTLLHTPADGRLTDAWVYLHPFADEMNKARRVAAQASRALAARGNAVLQIDLGGCGDSEGEFGEAAWCDWLEDVGCAVEWLRERCGRRPGVWGLRCGALLAAHWASRQREPVALLLWQPVASGKQQLAQFLRTRTVAEALAGGGDGTARALRATLAAGEALEIAGYVLAPGLAAELEHVELIPPKSGSPVLWLETGASGVRDPAPATQTTVGRWREHGCDVVVEAVAGPAFWQTVEIAESPGLVGRTLAQLAGRATTA